MKTPNHAGFMGRPMPGNQQMAARDMMVAAKHPGPMASSGLKTPTGGFKPRGGKRTSGGWKPHG